MQIRVARSIILAGFVAATAMVAACAADVTAPTVSTVKTFDTVRVVDTLHVVDTVLKVDTLRRVRVYVVAFHQDTTQEYFSCSYSLYCRETVPATAEFGGTLTVRGDSMVAVLDKVAFDPLPLTLVHLDSLPFRFHIFVQCPSLSLYVTGSSSVLHGRWVQQLDCHGLTRTGTLVATLQ